MPNDENNGTYLYFINYITNSKQTMKKVILSLVTAACLCPTLANAQEEEQRKFSIMPYVGVNYSNLSGYKFHEGSRTGSVNPTLGLQLQYNLSDKSALLLDYNYRRMSYTRNFQSYQATYHGFDKDFQETTSPYEVKTTGNYHTLGVQYKYNLGKGFSARAGVEAMWVSSGTDKYIDLGWGYALSDRGQFAIPLGLTYEHKNITVNATYHLPLSFGSDGEYAHIGDGKDRTWKTRLQTFDLTVGYRIPFGKKRK